ncbi:hypothetical protein MRBLMR1_004889 [Neorhizobium sp. LMR1-1-1.1]
MRPLNSMGLGLQAQPRPPTQGGGVDPSLTFAFTFNGEPFTFGGVAFTYGAP